VEGKVGDFCPNCKNCKAVTRTHDGKTASIKIIEVECVDPYDGMTKTLNADSDICCSMFEPESDRSCDKISSLEDELKETKEVLYKTRVMYSVLKKEKEELNMPSEARESIAKLNNIIFELEKEKAAHLKGIERLKKSQEKLQNQVKNLQTTNEESYKREEKLEDKVHKLERRLLEENKRFDRLGSEFLIPLVHILYPGEKVCEEYFEILEDIKLLNKGVYDLKEDNKRLADKNKALFEENLDRLDKHTKQCQEIDNLRNEMISLKTINKGLAEDRKKLINYMRSLKIASENYLKEFTYEGD
jgi:DNA repair exonuclease SbcCD ATPase subunit